MNIQYYRSSSTTVIDPTKAVLDSFFRQNKKYVILIKEGLPKEQWEYNVASMSTLGVDMCEFIFYDMNKHRSSVSTEIVRLLALVSTGLVENVFISSHERITYRLTALLMALCEVRNTKLVSALDIGKDLSIMAEFEFLRKEALIETNVEYKEATEAMQSTWDTLAIETHSKLCGLRKRLKGDSMVGNTHRKRYYF
jgi:hypothetical protein